jgi:tyrosyl-tRNA synthetase
MLARDVAKKIGRITPVAIHTPLLTSLQAGGRMNPIEAKMSKSKPDTMIAIHDTPDEVKKKLSKAYCPEKQVEGNPVLEICKFVIFPDLDGKPFLIQRPEKFGGNLEFSTYEALAEAFTGGLHPLDLKNATADHINKILAPVHLFFEKHPENIQKMRDAGILT